MNSRILRMMIAIIVPCIALAVMAGCQGGKSGDVAGGNFVQKAPSGTTVRDTTKNSTVSTNDGTGDKDKYAEYAPKEGKKYDIAWTAFLSNPVSEDAKIIKYHNQKYNVNINVWNLDKTKYSELLSLKFASGEVPDLIRVENSDYFLQYINQDILAEVPEGVMAKYAPILYREFTSNFSDDFFMRHGGYGGKVYGIPQVMAWSDCRFPAVYRGDWLKKLGFDKAPETLDEFEIVMYKFTNEDPDGNNKPDTFGLSNTGMAAVFGAFGYIPSTNFKSITHEWQIRDGKLVYAAVQPEMKEALRILNKWHKDGVLDPEFITGENIGNQQAVSFIQGRIGFCSNGGWWAWNPPLPGRSEVAKLRVELEKSNLIASESLVFGMPPTGPNGNRGLPMRNLFAARYCFGKHLEKEPDKLGKILQIIDDISFGSYENSLTAYYGMKGEDWNYDEFGIGVAKDLKWSGAEAHKIGGHNILRCVGETASAWKNPQSVLNWLNENLFREGGIRNEFLSALPSGGRFFTELDKLQAEAYIDIITGSKPVDYFDEFVEKWRKSGGDILEKEANQ